MPAIYLLEKVKDIPFKSEEEKTRKCMYSPQSFRNPVDCLSLH